jgi:hypothetical protein
MTTSTPNIPTRRVTRPERIQISKESIRVILAEKGPTRAINFLPEGHKSQGREVVSQALGELQKDGEIIYDSRPSRKTWELCA